MKKKQHVTFVLAFVLTIAAGLNSAHAVNFNPGDSFLLPGTTVLAEPQLASVNLEDESIPFSFVGDAAGGIISGTIQSRVARSTVDNTLDFYWRVFNDSSSVGPLGSFRLGAFTAPEFNANWRIDGSGDVGPFAGTRFSGGEFDYYFNFTFADLAYIQPGQSSKFMLLDTTATAYAKTAQMDVAIPGFGRISDNFATFSPIPEPSSCLLAICGLVIVALRRRSQK